MHNMIGLFLSPCSLSATTRWATLLQKISWAHKHQNQVTSWMHNMNQSRFYLPWVGFPWGFSHNRKAHQDMDVICLFETASSHVAQADLKLLSSVYAFLTPASCLLKTVDTCQDAWLKGTWRGILSTLKTLHIDKDINSPRNYAWSSQHSFKYLYHKW